jgi:hypothetical protein
VEAVTRPSAVAALHGGDAPVAEGDGSCAVKDRGSRGSGDGVELRKGRTTRR